MFLLTNGNIIASANVASSVSRMVTGFSRIY
nr:MAG TPA: hypothetical protein [Caudoviricetes sp.]